MISDHEMHSCFPSAPKYCIDQKFHRNTIQIVAQENDKSYTEKLIIALLNVCTNI